VLTPTDAIARAAQEPLSTAPRARSAVRRAAVTPVRPVIPVLAETSIGGQRGASRHVPTQLDDGVMRAKRAAC
jgi:hypothetical protein